MIANMNAAVAYLKSRPDVTGRVGAMGWCFGGGIALSFGLDGDDHDATAIFYGQLVDDPARPRQHDPRGVRHLRGARPGHPAGAVSPLRGGAREAGIENDVHVYDDVNHGFWLQVDQDPEGRTAAALDAWQRLKAYLDRTLGELRPTARPRASTAAATQPRPSRGSRRSYGFRIPFRLPPPAADDPVQAERPAAPGGEVEPGEAVQHRGSPPFIDGEAAPREVGLEVRHGHLARDRMKATGRVKSPTTMSRPPQNSRIPASPSWENSSTASSRPRTAKSFWAPCCMNMRPNTIAHAG